jgi:uncharacterized protein YecT (DUF1311 family)
MIASASLFRYNTGMKKIPLIALMIFLFYSPFQYAGVPGEHAIDTWLTGCMDKDPSTRGMNSCLGQAYEKWDVELNRVYRELSGKLDMEARAVLRETQRAWIAFRDRELAWLAKFYGGMDGTMYSTMLAADRVELVRKRALTLLSLLDVLREK